MSPPSQGAPREQVKQLTGMARTSRLEEMIAAERVSTLKRAVESMKWGSASKVLFSQRAETGWLWENASVNFPCHKQSWSSVRLVAQNKVRIRRPAINWPLLVPSTAPMEAEHKTFSCILSLTNRTLSHWARQQEWRKQDQVNNWSQIIFAGCCTNATSVDELTIFFWGEAERIGPCHLRTNQYSQNNFNLQEAAPLWPDQDSLLLVSWSVSQQKESWRNFSIVPYRHQNPQPHASVTNFCLSVVIFSKVQPEIRSSGCMLVAYFKSRSCWLKDRKRLSNKICSFLREWRTLYTQSRF